MRFDQFIKIVVSIAFCFLIGYLGSFFTVPAIEGWYSTLNKPFFAPPNWVFGPVWSTLYFLMGIYGGLLWLESRRTVALRSTIILFWVQLALNVVWCYLFFSLHNMVCAAIALFSIVAIAYWVEVFAYYFTRKKVYLYLIMPYIMWCTFALILNIGFIINN